MIEKRAAENALFAKVVESQRMWARRVVGWSNAVQVDPRPAYAHYFGQRSA